MRLNFFHYAMIIFWLSICTFVYFHEQAHVQVFKAWGIDSHVEYIKYFPDIATVTDTDSSNCKDACMVANANVDSFGYQFFPAFACVGLMLIIIIAYFEMFYNATTEWIK